MEQLLIDKKTLSDIFKKWIDDCVSENMKTKCGVIEDCLCELYAQPVVDAVPVIRCGECCRKDRAECPASCCDDHDGMGEYFTLPIMQYCNYGERKQDEILD